MQSNSNFTIYLIGFVIVIAGLAYGAHLAGAPMPWIVVGIIVLVGIGILSAVKRTQAPTTTNGSSTTTTTNRDEPPRRNTTNY